MCVIPERRLKWFIPLGMGRFGRRRILIYVRTFDYGSPTAAEKSCHKCFPLTLTSPQPSLLPLQALLHVKPGSLGETDAGKKKKKKAYSNRHKLKLKRKKHDITKHTCFGDHSQQQYDLDQRT